MMAGEWSKEPYYPKVAEAALGRIIPALASRDRTSTALSMSTSESAASWPERVQEERQEYDCLYSGRMGSTQGEEPKSNRSNRNRAPGCEESAARKGPEEGNSETAVGQAVEEAMACDDSDGECQAYRRSQTDAPRNQRYSEAYQKGGHEGVGSTSMTEWSLIRDTERKAKDICIWQKR
jgi:hypothetical protein